MSGPSPSPAAREPMLVMPPGAVVVLVGPAASGKTTLRESLLLRNSFEVISLDDERVALRERDVAAGRPPRELQDYSWTAVRRCEAAAGELLARGVGYLADATHLRRRERTPHVGDAHAAGLRAVAMLLPTLPFEELQARNARRPEFRRVPDEVLERHAHRRSLLTRDLLLEEGFDEVVDVVPRPL